MEEAQSEVVSMEGEASIQLGGNIELSGFHELAGSEMIVLKKIVGNYVRHMESLCKSFGGVKVHMKPLHQTGDTPKKFEFHAQLMDAGHPYSATTIERNMFVGIDAVMKKLVNEVHE